MAKVTALVEVQAAIFTILKGDTGAGGLVELTGGAPGRIYDKVPQSKTYPYVELGELEETPANIFGATGRMVLVTLHAYSTYSGYKELEQILERVILLLGEITLADTANWTMGQMISSYEIGSLAKEFDAVEFRHGIVRFLFQMEAKP